MVKHVARIGVFSYLPDSIYKQLCYESDIVSLNYTNDLIWDNVVFTYSKLKKKNVFVKNSYVFNNLFISRIVAYYRACRWLRSNYNKYDVIIIRHSSFLFFSTLFRKCFPKLIIEFHAIDECEINLMPINWFGRYVRKKIIDIIRWLLYGKAMAVMAVTPEILQYAFLRFRPKKNIKILYPNGVNLNTVNVVEDKREDDYKFVIMATEFYIWHGLKELLQEFKLFNKPFQLHIIGVINDDELSDMCLSDDRFFYHGFLQQECYRKILSKCDLALGSFHMRARGLTECATLKVREYFACGLPVCSGYIDPNLKNNPYYFYQNQIDITQFFLIAKELRSTSRYEVRASSVEAINKAEFVKNICSIIISINELKEVTVF